MFSGTPLDILGIGSIPLINGITQSFKPFVRMVAGALGAPDSAPDFYPIIAMIVGAALNGLAAWLLGVDNPGLNALYGVGFGWLAIANYSMMTQWAKPSTPAPEPPAQVARVADVPALAPIQRPPVA